MAVEVGPRVEAGWSEEVDVLDIVGAESVVGAAETWAGGS